MTAAVWIGVLGPIEVSCGGRPVVVGRRKERALLALLVAAANRTVPLDRIVDLLWGDEPPGQAASSLHAYISNLRRGLEPDRTPRTPATRLVTRPPGYALMVGWCWFVANRRRTSNRASCQRWRRWDGSPASPAWTSGGCHRTR